MERERESGGHGGTRTNPEATRYLIIFASLPANGLIGQFLKSLVHAPPFSASALWRQSTPVFCWALVTGKKLTDRAASSGPRSWAPTRNTRHGWAPSTPPRPRPKHTSPPPSGCTTRRPQPTSSNPWLLTTTSRPRRPARAPAPGVPRHVLTI